MALKNEFTVFLVDDDKMFLKMLEDNLTGQKAKYKINYKTFSSGEECLDNLNQNPDLIILDYYMDKGNANAMNGIQALRRIKEQNPNQEVIILSGQDKIEVAVETMKHGAFDYVIKNESAFLRSFNVIKNVINNMKNVEMLKVYRLGFFVVSIILILVFVLFAYLAIVYPDMIFQDKMPA